MTPEAAAEIQANMSVCQTLLIILSIWLAAKESRKWRTQLVETKGIELGVELNGMVWDMHRAFSDVVETLVVKIKPTHNAWNDYCEYSHEQMKELFDQNTILIKKLAVFHSVTGIDLNYSTQPIQEILRNLKTIERKKTRLKEDLSPADTEYLEKESIKELVTLALEPILLKTSPARPLNAKTTRRPWRFFRERVSAFLGSKRSTN